MSYALKNGRPICKALARAGIQHLFSKQAETKEQQQVVWFIFHSQVPINEEATFRLDIATSFV